MHKAAASVLALALLLWGARAAPVTAQAGTGTIKGHVRVTAATPANPPIRMGADPACAAMNRANHPVQEFVLKGASNGLANSVVRLDGTFAKTPARPQRVTIGQQNCIYQPRVVAAQVGQTLMVVNRDMTLHNVHSISAKGNAFNITQPKVGMVFSYVLKAAEILRLKCDVHSWMTGYVVVVDHPYFAETDQDGTFTIEHVPAGRQTVHAWHEAFGDLTRTITVKPGETVTVDLTYTSATRKSNVRDLMIPAGQLALAQGAP